MHLKPSDFDKDGKDTHWEKGFSFSINSAEILDIQMHKNETSFQFLTLQESTQNVLNTDMKYLKLLILKKTQGKCFRTLQWTMFFFKASKRTGNKNKNRQISYIKLKSFHKKRNTW